MSAVGQADDVALISSDLRSLKALLHLTQMYCDKYMVKLVATKTKLLVFTTKQCEMKAEVELATTTIEVDGCTVSPCAQATHVGVVRCPEGNGPNIAARLSAHRKAVCALMHSGLAKSHRANPAACLRIECVYGTAVLLSGLASLVLSSKEESTISQYYKVYIQRLLKLHQATLLQ